MLHLLRIGTGVDESIHVRVLRPGSSRPVGDSCCLAAGGFAITGVVGR